MEEFLLVNIPEQIIKEIDYDRDKKEIIFFDSEMFENAKEIISKSIPETIIGESNE